MPSINHQNYSELQSKNFNLVYSKVSSLLSDDTLPFNQKKDTLEIWLVENFPFLKSSVKRLSSFFLQQLPQANLSSATTPAAPHPSFFGIAGLATNVDLIKLGEMYITLLTVPLDHYITLYELKPADQKKLNHSNLCKLLLSMISITRSFPHKNGWIRFDSNIKSLTLIKAGLPKLSSKLTSSMLTIFHDYCGLDMRVVGSKNPVPCFRFTWQSLPAQICVSQTFLNGLDEPLKEFYSANSIVIPQEESSLVDGFLDPSLAQGLGENPLGAEATRKRGTSEIEGARRPEEAEEMGEFR